MTSRLSANQRQDTAGLPDVGTTPFVLRAFGVRIGVAIDPPELVAEAMLRLPPGWEPAGWHDLDRDVRIERADTPDSYTVRIDGEEPGAATTATLALDQFEDALQYYIAEFATPWLFVHAGVVGWRDRAIVLPGRSFSGKSTLVAALVAAGATYWSDEYAVLDAEGRVHPYPRRLALRTGPLGPAGRIDLSDSGPPIGAWLPVGLVAALKFDAVAGWAVEELGQAQAIMAMCDNTVAIQRRPRETLDYLARALTGAAAIRGTRGEVNAAVDRVLQFSMEPR